MDEDNLTVDSIIFSHREVLVEDKKFPEILISGQSNLNNEPWNGKILIYGKTNNSKNFKIYTSYPTQCGITSLSFLSESKNQIFASGGDDGQILFRNLSKKNKNIIKTYAEHRDYISSLSSNSNSELLSSSFDKTVKLWKNSKSDNLSFQTFSHPQPVLKTSWFSGNESSDCNEKNNFITLCQDDKIRFFDTRVEKTIFENFFFKNSQGKPLIFDSHKNNFAISYENGSVLIYDIRKLDSESPKKQIHLKSQIYHLAFSPFDDEILSCSSINNSLFILNFEKSKIKIFPSKKPLRTSSWSKLEKGLLATGGVGKDIFFLDILKI